MDEYLDKLKGLFSGEIAGLTYYDLMISFLIILFAFLFRRIIAQSFFKALKTLASRTKTDWDDKILNVLETPVSNLIVLVGVYLGFSRLEHVLTPATQGIITNAFKVLAILIVFRAILRLTNVISEIACDLSNKKGHSIGAFVPLINKAVRVFLMMLCAMLVIQNLGYNIGTVIGALGIGGAAFAFAAKDSIANLYGSLALALDRPFKVGDWIMVGDKVDGDVVEIGLRSTKVRTWPKTIMSIPNNILANEIINNWSLMPKRRVKQIVGITYESHAENMEEIVEDIRELLRKDEGVNQEFILVNFTDFGESSLNVLVYYFTKTTKWLEYMDVRQRINCKIMNAVKARGLSMAFPTRTLYLEGDIAKQLASRNTTTNTDNLPGDHGPSSPP